MCFVHASNDPISSENSVALYLACKKAGVPAEMHLYAAGGHGFGMRKGPHPCSTWPDRVAEWMAARGVLKNTSAPPAKQPPAARFMVNDGGRYALLGPDGKEVERLDARVEEPASVRPRVVGDAVHDARQVGEPVGERQRDAPGQALGGCRCPSHDLVS